MPRETLYLCCPSYALQNPLEKRDYVARARAFARRFGLKLVVSPLLDRHLPRGTWLDADARRDDIAEAVRHDVVWACQGGYGGVHLTETLLSVRVAHRPRLIGYSDITVLHACWRVRGWGETYYGQIPRELEGSREGGSLLPLFAGRPVHRDGTTDAAAVVLRPGRAEGPCFAACLSVLAGLVGTPAMPSLRGCVLAVEDVDEKPYQVDFALAQLYASGALEDVVALVGGSFTHQAPLDYGGPGVDDVLKYWAERLGVPAISRLPFGHLPDSLVLCNGRTVRLEAEADGRWSLVFAARRDR